MHGGGGALSAVSLDGHQSLMTGPPPCTRLSQYFSPLMGAGMSVASGLHVRAAPLLLLAGLGCSSIAVGARSAQADASSRGPWAEVPAVEMPTEDSSIPINLIRDAADALLRLPGARVCDPATRKPIVGLSMEYCSTLYVAGSRESLSWRVTEPREGNHESCAPFFDVRDEDHSASQIWIVGYIHNHPCATAPSSRDLAAWPTDDLAPYVAMAEVRLTPGNPAPAMYKHTAVEMASAIVAERPDGTRVYLRYFPTGEIQQWRHAKSEWVSIGRCSPRDRSRFGGRPLCDGPLRVLRD